MTTFFQKLFNGNSKKASHQVYTNQKKTQLVRKTDDIMMFVDLVHNAKKEER